MCSYPKLMNDKMMHIENIHFEMSNEIRWVGAISEDHRLKTRRLMAVNVSTAYTATDMMRDK